MGKLQQNIKIQVSSYWNQSTLRCSSTILHPVTEIRGQKFARTVNKLWLESNHLGLQFSHSPSFNSNIQKAKFVYHSSIISLDEISEH